MHGHANLSIKDIQGKTSDEKGFRPLTLVSQLFAVPLSLHPEVFTLVYIQTSAIYTQYVLKTSTKTKAKEIAYAGDISFLLPSVSSPPPLPVSSPLLSPVRNLLPSSVDNPLFPPVSSLLLPPASSPLPPIVSLYF